MTGNGVCARLKSNAFYVCFLLFFLSFFLFDIPSVQRLIFNNNVRFHRHKQLYPPSNMIFRVLLRVQIEWNGPATQWVSEYITSPSEERRKTFLNDLIVRAPHSILLIIFFIVETLEELTIRALINTDQLKMLCLTEWSARNKCDGVCISLSACVCVWIR